MLGEERLGAVAEDLPHILANEFDGLVFFCRVFVAQGRLVVHPGSLHRADALAASKQRGTGSQRRPSVPSAFQLMLQRMSDRLLNSPILSIWPRWR
jgi:hypothetical protein